MNSIQMTDQKYVANTYGRFPVTLVRGSGSLVYDENGKAYIDMGSGIAVTAFGMADPAWTEAVTAQLTVLQHTSNLYYTEPCARLAQMLCERTGMSKVFFCNSGAEANECAIKAARKYAEDARGEIWPTIVTLKNSFHGRTLTTLAATGQEHYHELYRPLTPGFAYAEAGDMECLKRIFREEKVAGVLVECIQGEGGVVEIDEAYLRQVQELAHEHQALMMIDEVQTGNGRTGDLYAYMHAGLAPDVVTTAKGLGGGLPIGACLLSEKVSQVFGHGDHGSTFGGNPVACAGAVSVLGRMDEALLEEVRKKGNHIRRRLEGAPGVSAVSGRGLMVGVLPAQGKAAGDVVRQCLDRGILFLTAKDRVRMLPALNIPMDLLDNALDTLLEVLGE